MKNFVKIMLGDYMVKDGYSEFANGRRVYDKDVAKLVKQRTLVLERLLFPDKVVSKTIVAHAELCEKVQNK